MAQGVTTQSLNRTRWTQLIAGVICMIMIANLQYGWTLFVGPMNKARGWDVASIQLAFSIFVALETWLTPLEGWIVDLLGARRGDLPPLKWSSLKYNFDRGGCGDGQEEAYGGRDRCEASAG